jgi:dTMP kinase
MNTSAYPPLVWPRSFKTPASGIFISFEGIEGCGKSTQLKNLQAYLGQNQDLKFSLVREPGSTPFGEHLRQAILQSTVALHPLAEAYLFATARAQLLAQTILPALARQEIVIADRYLDSSLAYQGMARHLGLATILAIHQYEPLCTLPHLTFYLRISPEVSQQRQQQRAQQADYFEQQPLSFYQSLVEGYDQVAAACPQRYIILDGTQDPTQIFTQIKAALKKRWPQKAWPC